MDPEANVFVQGPHPAEPDRNVFFWFEVCDPVQTPSVDLHRRLPLLTGRKRTLGAALRTLQLSAKRLFVKRTPL